MSSYPDTEQTVDTVVDLQALHAGMLLQRLRSRITQMPSCCWNASPHMFVRFSVPVDELVSCAASDVPKPIYWLMQFPTVPRIYWRDRLGIHEYAGVGITHCIQGCSTSVPSLVRYVHYCTGNAPDHVRYYGGMRFYTCNPVLSDTVWSAVPDAAFTMPLLEFEYNDHDACVVHCTVMLQQGQSLSAARHKAAEQLEHLERHVSLAHNTVVCSDIQQTAVMSRVNAPEHHDWRRNVRVALREIESGRIEKVVLARRATMLCRKMLDPLRLLHQLMPYSQHTTAFLLSLTSDAAMIGTTPEMLYKRSGNIITTEAIAGTRRRGSTPSDDERMSQELYTSAKDRREHAAVQRYVAAVLDEITESFTIGSVDVLQLAHLQHLYAECSGKLRPEIDDAAIIARLHPTPAVGGLPRPPALSLLERIEGFDRGWYAAPVGWLNAHAAEFAVAIRSALVAERCVHAFSGAGIVAGSEPETEWQEIEMKITPILSALYNR
ncbi:MAG: isochorismate synthase [Bacteroidota bacterium]|nr:isochorismate synthase [Candidatus Kapabacteria bacterium]MDW8220366.1 isochorismate synthase [Bacteroidota bacterium]